MNQPPLKFLHTESSLIELKLEYFRRISTDELIESLKPEKTGALKTKVDGTIMDGHHRASRFCANVVWMLKNSRVRFGKE